MKLKTIIVLAFVIVAIICATGVIYYLYDNSSKVLKQQVIVHLETTATSRENHILTYFEDNKEELKLILSRTQLLRDIESYNAKPSEESREIIIKKLEDSKNSLSEIDRIYFIGLGGIVKASSNRSFIERDVKNEDFFINGKNDYSVQFIEEDGEIRLFFSGPFILEGKTIGVGVMIISPEDLNGIVEEKTGLGNTGEVLIAIKQGDKINYLVKRLFESSAINQNQETENIAVPMKNALAGNEASFMRVLDYRGVEVISVSRYLADYKMGLVAKIDYSEAVSSLDNRFFYASIYAFIGVILVVIIFSIIIANGISKPLKRLTSDIDTITQGKLDIQLEKSSISEIQSLIDSLNRILATMKLAILRTGLSKGELGLGEAVKAKEEAEDKYKTLYETSNDAIMILEPPTWKFTFGNPAAVKIFNTKDEKEFTSLGPWDLSPEKQPDGQLSSAKAKKMIEKAMKEGSNFFEWTHKRYKGENFPVTVLLTRFKLKGKDVLQATVRDLTVEKKAEEEMDLHSEIMKNMSEGVYLIGLNDGIIKYTNPKFEKMFGYKPGEMIGKDVSIVNAPTNKDPKKTAKEIMEIIRKTGEWHGEVNNIKKDGTKFWSYANVSVMEHPVYGKVLVAVHRDITEQKKIEEEVNVLRGKKKISELLKEYSVNEKNSEEKQKKNLNVKNENKKAKEAVIKRLVKGTEEKGGKK